MHGKRFLAALRFFLACLLLLWATGCAGHWFTGEPPAPVPVTILFFNDLHGHLQPFEIKGGEGRQEAGGIARMASLVRQIREENSRKNVRTLVLVAGDILQGTPMSTVFRGEPDVECLNAMGVDALAVGNHEFDFGLDNFHRLQTLAAFPFLSANIVDRASGRPLCLSSRTLPLADDLAVTIIGVTTEDLLTTTMPANVASLDVRDAVLSVGEVYGRVHSRGPVILLSHAGYKVDGMIAMSLPGLAAIVGGHDHVLISPYQQVGPVPIFQALEKGRYLGRVDLMIDPVSGRAVVADHAYLPITDRVASDPQVAAIVAAWQGQLGDRFKQVIGRAEVFLDGERGRIRYEETALGNWVTDVVREHTGAQIALINAGAMRTSIRPGPVTVEDVFKTMPFANELVLMDLTGAEIGEVLRRAVRSSRGDNDGGFLQVSGLTFEVRDHTVENVRVGPERQPLQSGALYRVAVTDFMATGGDGYTLLKGKPQIQTGLPLRELIVDTIRRRGVINAREEGRILRRE